MLCYTNADQLFNKKNELKQLVFEKKPDIIHITEVLPKNDSNLDPDFDFKTEFKLDGYDHIMMNKNPKRGILVYVKSELDVCFLDTKSEQIENVCCELKVDNKIILFGCLYRSPSLNKKDSTSKLIEFLQSLEVNKYDNVILTGDYNYPDINWDDLSNEKDGPEKELIDCLQNLYLQQMISKPTRNKHGQRSNILDLIFTNDDSIITNVEHIAPLGKSDHDVLLVPLNLQKSTTISQEPRFNFNKTDFTSFKQFLNDNNKTDWSNLDNTDINENYDYLLNVMHEGFSNYVPKCTYKEKSQPIWMNRKTMKCIKKKYQFFKRFQSTKTYHDYENYIKIRNKTKKQIKEAVREYERKICNESKVNAKCFWKHVNSKLKRKTGVPNLNKPDGNLTETDEEKATILNDFFSSVFTIEDTNNIPNLDSHCGNETLKNINISQELIENKLRQLNPNKAMGPDKIPTIVLKELASELSYPLYKIFN